MGCAMRNCLLCPRGTKCRGYVLHGLIVKLYDAMQSGEDADGIARAITREDALLLADYGGRARETCWSKGFVLAVAAKLSQTVAAGVTGDPLRRAIEQLIVRMDMLFAKLPGGIKVDLMDLTVEIYNQAVANLREAGSGGFLPTQVVGQAAMAVVRAKEEKQ